MKPRVNIFWFRRDLRLQDNAGLFHALKEGTPVVPVFIFDRNILDELEDRIDRRVEFIHLALQDMQKQLEKIGSTLDVRYGTPVEIYKELTKEYEVNKVFTNHDYEPYAKQRDAEIEKLLQHAGASFHTFKDQVIFEKSEVVKDDAKPYTVFTPYSKRWKATLKEF
jgi:deoxyribodipyrimidine photo-lyase